MTIESVAKRDVLALDEACDARDAAQAMRDRHVGSVIVTRGKGRAMQLVGIVTDRDIAMALALDGRPPETPLQQLARRPLVTVSHTASVVDAARIMQSAAVRRLVLVDEHGHMLGIVSADDMLAATDNVLHGLIAATRWRHETPAEPLHDDAAFAQEHAPLLVSPALAESWRHIVRT